MDTKVKEFIARLEAKEVSQSRKNGLKNWEEFLKNLKIDENLREWLDNLLEAHSALTQHNIPFIHKQFNKAKEKLKSKLGDEELVTVCQLQTKLIKLEAEWKIFQDEKMEAKVENNL